MKQELSITTVFLIVALFLFHFVFHSTYVGEWRTLSTMAIDAGGRRILLVPLDSRPPCREFVVSGGRIVGWNVITPPTEYMDYYSKPGNTEAVRRWRIPVR